MVSSSVTRSPLTNSGFLADFSYPSADLLAAAVHDDWLETYQFQ